MRYWWVNQNQTFDQEFGGGYLWSPKVNAADRRNHFYETMREVAPGDLILSFYRKRIEAIGIARSYCYECPKPKEFGEKGAYWDLIGWRVDVGYSRLQNRIQPASHMELIRPELPEKYSPLQKTGRGLQGVYLTEVQPGLMGVMAQLIGREVQDLIRGRSLFSGKPLDSPWDSEKNVETWEDHLEQQISEHPGITETDRLELVRSRKGQGQFRSRVALIEKRCRITKVEKPEHLIASHCKPWRHSSNEERLNGENGFFLTPSIDHLFDRGFISFEDNGRLLVAPRADETSLNRMGVVTDQSLNVGGFTAGQRKFLDFHRNEIFLESR